MTASTEILGRLECVARSAQGAIAAVDGSGRVALRLQLDEEPHAVRWLAGFAQDDSCERFYWRHPAERLTVLGLGIAGRVETEGARRFADASSSARALLASTIVVGDDGPDACGPLLLGGFSFAGAPLSRPSPLSPLSPVRAAWSDFPGGRLVLPELLLVEREGALWLTVCVESDDSFDPLAPWLEALFDRGRVATDCGVVVGEASGFEREGPHAMDAGPEYRVRSDRSHADYRAQVEAAREAIAGGDVEKVVLARSLRVRHDGRFDVPSLLQRLLELYPECATFAIAPAAASRPGACFLGATPELLVSRSGDRVFSSAVAGSAARGRTPEDDDRLGRDLRESKKEQEEHAFVVREIARALEPACEALVVPEAPRLLRLEGIQHLHTPIDGVLRDEDDPPSVIDLGASLHPTPAVGGVPQRAAVDWIARCEGFDRGWYAGPIGFVDRTGGGELRVALRSALLRHASETGDEALLFAGGGIVADSDPDRELEETRIKLRALLAPLTEI